MEIKTNYKTIRTGAYVIGGILLIASGYIKGFTEGYSKAKNEDVEILKEQKKFIRNMIKESEGVR